MKSEHQHIDLVETEIREGSDRPITSSRTWLEVADAMSKDVATISSDETVVSVAKVMADKNISCIIAVDNGSVAGILTETDILKRAVAKEKDFDKVRVADIMSSPVESIPPDVSILEASRIMEAKHIKRLPILTERGLVGIVTQTDLIRALTSYGMWRDVAEIMSRDVAGIQRKETVVDAAKIMTSHNISCVIALEADQVVGVLTERDLLKRVVALKKNPTHIKVEQVMSSPAISISPSYSVFSASRIMKKMDIRRLVVMEDKGLCGIVTQTDILRAIKNKLQAEEEKNFRLLENSKSSIYTIDLEGKTTYVNPSFMKLLDVSDPEELINQPFLPERFWLNPEKRAQFLKRLVGGNIETMELALKTSKGRKVYVTLFSAFTKNAHGEINGNQGILYDITAKKELVVLREAEEELRQYESMVASSNDMIALLNRDFTYLATNDAYVSAFGKVKDEVIGHTAGEVFGKEFFESVIKPCAERCLAGEEVHYDDWFNFPFYGRHYMDISYFPYLGESKEIRGFVVYGRNITDRKQIEEEKEKTLAEMERMNRLMTGREMRVIEMKKEVNALLGELGKEPEYKSVLEETEAVVSSDKAG